MKRRAALIGLGAVALAGAGAVLYTRRRVAGAAPRRPPGVPLGPFGADSTAEEVTAGLNLGGHTALVTGATSGLGFETARVLALRGAQVLVSGRTLDKAKAACAALPGRTTPIAFELERWDTVAAAADLVRALGMPLDILVCNAGIMALPKLEQVYGLEKQFVVNHLGHFILVNRLLPQIKAARQGRVVAVSSLGYRWAPPSGIEFDNLSGERGYEPYKMYGQSKLANALMTLALAGRLRAEGSAVTANAVHPGVIDTNLGRHFPAWKRLAGRFVGWTFMKDIPQGAATACYVATAPALADVSGHYFEDCNPVVPAPGMHMDDSDLAARLWARSESLVKEYLA
jgi:NAD(P)-dependent dehydrogenase (short-subunit alcohol dehydrogenase family)